MNNIICPSCKTSAPPGAVFCDNCGFDLRVVSAGGEKPPPQVVQAEAKRNEEITCSNCQHINIMGSLFCENCGAQLFQKPSIQNQPPEPVVQVPDNKLPVEPQGGRSDFDLHVEETALFIPGRLLIQPQNLPIPIPAGSQSVVVGREDPVSGIFPDIDLEPFGGHEAGVGRKHAQFIIEHGQIYIEDLDSVNGTAVNKQRLEPHKPKALQHGDELRFGKLIVTYMKE